jgi:hypothetical protein
VCSPNYPPFANIHYFFANQFPGYNRLRDVSYSTAQANKMSASDSEDFSEEEVTKPSKVPLLTPRGSAAPAPSYFEESNIHQKIDLSIVLPDGSIFQKTFSKGDTVFNIKKAVHDEKGVEWKGMNVEFNGKVVLDPLSFNDIPGLCDSSSATVHIKH